MIHVEPKDISVQEVWKYLLGGVAPRPIALVSTISTDGVPNLSPFSFFNAFGSNPPTVVFSPTRRVRDGTLKDTYHNLTDTKECVIQAVTYSMVQQVSLASTEYPSDVDEFIKSGLTPVPSDLVKPPRVKESPFQMECLLKQMIHIGEKPGSANLAVCEVVTFHIAEDILRNGVIDPDLIDLVGRNSANFYTRASGSAIFEVEKPRARRGIGFDNLPQFIKDSQVLTANNLSQLANTEKVPTKDEVAALVDGWSVGEVSEELFYRYSRHHDYQNMARVAVSLGCGGHSKAKTFMELAAKSALEHNDVEFAWKLLMYSQESHSG